MPRFRQGLKFRLEGLIGLVWFGFKGLLDKILTN